MAGEGTSRKPFQKGPKAIWNAVNRKLYIDIAYEEVLKGNRLGSGFTKEGWKSIKNEFNRRTKNSHEMKKFKNFHNRLKDEWKLWDKMMNKTSGFGFDPVSKTVTAADEVWNDFIKENLDAAIFRTRPLEHQEELQIFFTGTMATGELMGATNAGRLTHEMPNASQPPPEQTKDDTFTNAGRLAHELPNASQPLPEQTKDDTFRDDGCAPRTQMGAEEPCGQKDGDVGSHAVGEARPLRRRRSESSISSYRSKKESRGASIDTHIRMMSRYFEWKMNERSKMEMYDIPACIKRLNELPGMERGTPLKMFALEMLQSEAKRKTFMTIVDDADECLAWIRFQMRD